MSATLLLVDDEAQNLELLEGFLEPLGHKMLFALGGKEALEILAKGCVDLVLLDVMMPGVTGFDVLSRLSAQPSYRQVPVVLVTAAADREHRLKGLQLGAWEFLEKPVDQAILLARVRALLQHQFVTDELIRRNETLELLRNNQEETMQFIAHDLRNPLAIIRANLQFLRSSTEEIPVKRQEAIDDSEHAVRRADGMIADLLAVARAEHAALELEKTPFSLGTLLSLIHHSYVAEAHWRGVDFVVDILPHIELFADAELLRRVLDNIVSNALRHTPRGGRIEVRAISGEVVQVRVANSGPPIPVDERSRVFEKFWRAKGSPKSGAVGLGLYFCRMVVEAHGGQIAIEQTDSWPTVFVINLPVYEGRVRIQ